MSLPKIEDRAGRVARISAVAALTVLAPAGTGCVRETLRYPHATAETTAQAWSDAFNRDEKGQLRLLVHPDRRAIFDEHAPDLAGQLKAYDVAKWQMGERVIVDGKIEGREITLFFTDSTTVRENKAVLVQTDGDWWLWKY